MKLYNDVKKGLHRFIYRIAEERDLSAIKNYLLELKNHSDFDSYFDDVVESITPPGPETDRDLEIKYNYIGSNLAIVAGLYYGDDLSLEHIERDYPEEIAKHSLDRES